MKKLLPLLLSVITLSGVHAASVNWAANSNLDMVLENSSSALLEAGSLVRLGYFSLSDLAIQGLVSAGDISGLNAAFTPFGSVSVGTGFSGDPGSFTTSTTALMTPALLNNQIYYWALKSGDNTNIATSLATASEQAIFYRNKSNDSEWAFPGDLAPTPTIDASDLGVGGLASGGVVLAGSYIVNSVSGAIYNGQATSAIRLQDVVPIPEPGTLAFGVLLGCAAVATRRRRRA